MSHAVRALEGLCKIGMKAALLATTDGLLIDAVSCDDAGDVDPSETHAIVAAVAAGALQAAQLMATELMRTGVTSFFVELESGGSIIVHPIGEYGMVVLLTDTTATLGRLRLELRRLAPVIESTLVGVPSLQTLDEGAAPTA